MARARSPGYPAIGLKEALERVRRVYEKDHLNKVPKAVIASHMGYKSLSGASLPVLAALNQYGLLEGRGDETRVSNLALQIIVHEPGAGMDRLTSLREAATRPELFNEIHKRFPGGQASDAAIRSFLLMEKFIPSAADTAIRSYRETRDLVDAEEEAYRQANPEQAAQVDMEEALDEATERGEFLASGVRRALVPPRKPTMLQEVFALEEGPVTVTFPAALSADSYQDLADHFEIFLRKAKRRAQAEQ